MPARDFGNLIALPLQNQPRQKGNGAFIDGDFRPYRGRWARREQPPRMARPFEPDAMIGPPARPPSDVANSIATYRLINLLFTDLDDKQMA